MTKTVDPKETHNKNKNSKDQSHNKEYSKKHEKGHFPRKVWPTDSEKNKGPKV